MKLIVSLPENDLELGEAAEAGGADIIKVHLNVVHEASGTHFGTWNEEKEKILSLKSKLKCQVMLMPGADVLPSEEEFEEIYSNQIDILDIYVDKMKLFMLGMKPQFETVVAIRRFEEASLLDEIIAPMEGSSLTPSYVEASFVQEEAFGERLSLKDVATYRKFAQLSPLPVIIPTQKLIEPEDIFYLKGENVGAIMLGVIATGRSASSIEHVTRLFRKMIDKT